MNGKSDVSPVTPKREAVIAKIRALMAKTVENGATEAEAKAASAKIHKLMSAYAIEVTDTAIEVTYTGDGDVERPRRRRRRATRGHRTIESSSRKSGGN